MSLEGGGGARFSSSGARPARRAAAVFLGCFLLFGERLSLGDCTPTDTTAHDGNHALYISWEPLTKKHGCDVGIRVTYMCVSMSLALSAINVCSHAKSSET